MERLSASQVINLILPIFRDYGYDGASLTILAKASGLSRASLYHHFPGGKQEMARAALSRSGAALTRLILAPLNRAESPQLKVQTMFLGVKSYYASDPPICLMNSLTLGTGRALFGDEVNAAVQAWQVNLAHVLQNSGLSQKASDQLATAAIERIQGALIMARVCGTKLSFDEAIDDLAQNISVHIS